MMIDGTVRDGALWLALDGFAGFFDRYLIADVKETRAELNLCRQECRRDREATTIAINTLVDAVAAGLEKGSCERCC